MDAISQNGQKKSIESGIVFAISKDSNITISHECLSQLSPPNKIHCLQLSTTKFHKTSTMNSFSSEEAYHV